MFKNLLFFPQKLSIMRNQILFTLLIGLFLVGCSKNSDFVAEAVPIEVASDLPLSMIACSPPAGISLSGPDEVCRFDGGVFCVVNLDPNITVSWNAANQLGFVPPGCYTLSFLNDVGTFQVIGTFTLDGVEFCVSKTITVLDSPC